MLQSAKGVSQAQPTSIQSRNALVIRLQTNRTINQPIIKAVIFDLGGVILRTDDPAPRLKLAEQLGKSRLELEDIVFNNPFSAQAEEGLATPEDVWNYVQQTLNLTIPEVAAFRHAFFSGDHVDFEIVRLLQALRHTYRTALLSNTWYVDLTRVLSHDLGIPEDTFDVVISSAKEKIAKPKPGIFNLTVDRLSIEPSQAIFIDDNDLNIEGAKKVGLHTIRFYNPSQTRQELLQYIDLPAVKES